MIGTDYPEVFQPDPFGGPQNGADVLRTVEHFLARFVAYPTEAAKVAHTLWIAHTWLMDAWESTPRIAFLSPEPGSGKSRALEVTELLVPRPLHAVNASPAALFRKVSDEDGAPTILFDEIDTVFGPRAKDNEDIRGMLNAGHRRGATALRCVIKGKDIDVVEFPAYCAVALAGLDDLPDTIATRSVIIRMRRRAPGEVIEPFRHRLNAAEGHAIANVLGEWTASVRHTVAEAWPTMPDGIEDRNADVWEALLAVADAAGEDWPDRARVTAVTLVTASSDRGGSLGVRLLTDIRQAFTANNTDKLSTTNLLDYLAALDESPWGDLRGKPLDGRGLSRRLARYEIKPKPLRIGEQVFKGYERNDLLDAWSRYLPATEVPVTDSPQTGSLLISTKQVEKEVAGVRAQCVPPPLTEESVTAVTAVTRPAFYAAFDDPCPECQRRAAFASGPCAQHQESA
jgi:hypothetical protein